MDLVDNTGLNGLMKLWIYQHIILSRIAWPFIINDFSYSLSIEMEKSISVRLKKWAFSEEQTQGRCFAHEKISDFNSPVCLIILSKCNW